MSTVSTAHLQSHSCLDLPPRPMPRLASSATCVPGVSQITKIVATDCSANTSIKGKTYCLSSQEAKANFLKNPTANLAKAESFYKSEHKG